MFGYVYAQVLNRLHMLYNGLDIQSEERTILVIF